MWGFIILAVLLYAGSWFMMQNLIVGTSQVVTFSQMAVPLVLAAVPLFIFLYGTIGKK